MGELILMLLLTCVVCGGIPTLAFAYINGKIKFSNHGKTPSKKQKRTVFRWQAFPYKKGCLLKTVPMLMAFNSLYILVGMGCRYLLEFGEVSNTYNFTVPNMIVHVLLINILCLACWYLVAKMPRKGIR